MSAALQRLGYSESRDVHGDHRAPQVQNAQKYPLPHTRQRAGLERDEGCEQEQQRQRAGPRRVSSEVPHSSTIVKCRAHANVAPMPPAKASNDTPLCNVPSTESV